MNGFKTYHPAVNFIYFIFVIGFSVFILQPVCLCISFLCGVAYSAIVGGNNSFRKVIFFTLPLMLTAILINVLFNHRGATIIGYFPNGNPLTLESVLYGCATGLMLIGVMSWFSCYNSVMTSDKFIYIFGRIMPSLSLIFSMTLRFVPKFSHQLKEVSDAQNCIENVSEGSLIKKAKHGLSILSAMITWSLESSVETADSMKSRGYGLPGRTSFSLFRFDKRDKICLVCILVLGLYTFVGVMLRATEYSYFPKLSGINVSLYTASVFGAYFALCVMPIIIEIKEVIKWKSIKSGI